MARNRTDRGWAWVVLFASITTNVLVIGFIKCFGLFLIEFISIFESSATMATVLFAVQCGCNSVTSLFVLSIGVSKWSCRQMVIIGGLLFCVAYLMGSFAPSMGVLIVSNGILVGIATGMTLGPALVVVGNYFVRWRGLATGLTQCGGSLGGLVLPFFIHALLIEYGLRGTLLVTGGLLFNLCVLASLMQPFKQKIETDSPGKSRVGVSLVNDKHTRLAFSAEHLTSPSGTNDTKMQHYSKPKPETILIRRTFSHPVGNVESVSHKSINDILDAISKSSVLNYGSSCDLTWGISLASLSGKVEKNDEINTLVENGRATPKMSRLSSKLALLKNKLLLLMIICSMLLVPGCGLVAIFIPPHARDLGVDEEKSSHLVSILGATDIVGRLICALISDTGWVQSHNVITTAALISGASCLLMPFYTEFWSMCLFCAVYGTFGGVYFALFVIVLIDLLGIKNLPFSLAVVTVCQGIAVTAAVPILGYMRDSSGSYLLPFYTLGSTLVLGGCVLAMEPLVDRWEKSTSNHIQNLHHAEDILLTVDT